MDESKATCNLSFQFSFRRVTVITYSFCFVVFVLQVIDTYELDHFVNILNME